jgi:hypothetical protein
MTSTMIKHIAIGFRLAALVLLGAGAGQLAAAAVSATSADASSTSSLTSKGIDAVLGASKAKSGGDEFLPPDEAFRFDAIPDGPDHVRLIWQIADG